MARTVGQNFFGTATPPDRYNAENFTFTRGPNAIRFGLGNTADASTSSTKRTHLRNRYVVEFEPLPRRQAQALPNRDRNGNLPLARRDRLPGGGSCRQLTRTHA